MQNLGFPQQSKIRASDAALGGEAAGMEKRSLMSLTRLEAFSDGVFSIAATLLVLEFKIPNLHGADAQHVNQALVGFGGPALAYVTSFFVIGVVWINHHPLFHDLESVDRPTVILNLILLLVVAFLPFPTEMLSDYGTIPQVVMLYGFAQAGTGIAFNMLSWYVAYRYRAQTEAEVSRRALLATRLFALAYPAISLIGAALAYVHPSASIAIYIALPLAYLMPNAIEWSLTRR